MAQMRAQIITSRVGDLPRDHIVNTVHFAIEGPWSWLTDGANLQEVADDIKNMMAQERQYIPTGYGVEVKVYDIEQELPREVKAHSTRIPYAFAAGNPAPREVALCLSFHGQRNIPRQRGRIFIGPWTQSVAGERPPAEAQANCIAIANGLAGIGGFDVAWAVRSKFPIQAGDQGGTMHPIRNSWSDNEWDTVRARGLRATSRVTEAQDE